MGAEYGVGDFHGLPISVPTSRSRKQALYFVAEPGGFPRACAFGDDADDGFGIGGADVKAPVAEPQAHAIGVILDKRNVAVLVEDLAQREQRMILAHTDIVTGKILCPALAHDDISRDNVLTAIFFDAEIFGVRIASIS